MTNKSKVAETLNSAKNKNSKQGEKNYGKY